MNDPKIFRSSESSGPMAVENPVLRQMVAELRQTPPPAPNVNLDEVLAETEKRQNTKFRWFATLSTAAAAACLLVWTFGSSTSNQGVAQTSGQNPVAVQQPKAPAPAEPSVATESSGLSQIATWVKIQGNNDQVEFESPWTIRLKEAPQVALKVQVARHAPQPLLIHVGNRKLELVEGELELLPTTATANKNAEPKVEFQINAVLRSGVAAWVSNEGTRSVIKPSRTQKGESSASTLAKSEFAKPSKLKSPSKGQGTNTAGALARKAEQQLQSSDLNGAVSTLRQLIQEHPRSSSAKSAILDLARILRRQKKRDQAHCAYQWYLKRWPEGGLKNEVEASVQRLGSAAKCQGLRPVTK